MGFFHRASLRSQRGSAIIFAIGMSLLVSALSVALLLWLMMDIRRVEQLASGSERIATLEIIEAMAAANIKSLGDDWNMPMNYTQEETNVQGQLMDLSGRMNINILFKRDLGQDSNPSFMPQTVVKRLFKSMHMLESESVIDKILSSGTDLFGVNNHADLKPASEFLYAVDPEIQQVNINTTSPEVLAAILDIPLGMADMILKDRPFESMQDIINILAKYELKYDSLTSLEGWLDVESHYYVLETLFADKHKTRIYTVFHKDEDKITLLWRSWGNLP